MQRWLVVEMFFQIHVKTDGIIDVLKKHMLLFFVASLTACAGSTVQQDPLVETVEMKKVTSPLSIDSDVSDDFNSAVKLIQQEQYGEAITILNSVVKREKRLPAPYVNLAIAYNKTGNTTSAEEHLINALKLDIGHPVANNELGLLYRKKGKFNAARTAYENAIKEHPEYLPVVMNLGVLCDLYLHDFECALQQFEDYLELKPDDKAVAIWVADVKRRLK